MDVEARLAQPLPTEDEERLTALLALALARWLAAVDSPPDVRVYADDPEEVRRP
jgi:hypothetical protein